MNNKKTLLRILSALILTPLVVLSVWPRPAVEIRIPVGGIAKIHKRFGLTAALPETISVASGGRPKVRIINADTIPHKLGMFSAPAGEQVEYTLPQPGTYTGLCSAHPTSETLTFVVR